MNKIDKSTHRIIKITALGVVMVFMAGCVVEPAPPPVAVAPGPAVVASPYYGAPYYGCCYAYSEYPPYYGYGYGPAVGVGFYGGGRGGWHR
jgi:hypothetical protein